MELWAMGAMVVLAIGVTLIGIGWHGRRIDRHPLCAACGFDLIGRPPGGPRCAECGADVSGLDIRVGHRACRTRPLYGGLALSIPALLVIGSMTYVEVRGIDVMPHKPAWWLVRELAGAGEVVALAELTARVRTRALAPDHVAEIAEHCLDNQRNPRVAWNPLWGSFLESAHAAGTLSKEHWARYALQGFVMNAYALTITPGTPLPVHVELIQSRHAPKTNFVPRLEVRGIRVDGRGAAASARPFTMRWRVSGIRVWERLSTESRMTTISGEQVETLPDGAHELSATVVLSICEGGEFGDVVATRTLELRSPFNVQQPTVQPFKFTAAMQPTR